jgi:hypothetical protein
MGTLSKRRLEDFGADIRDRVESVRTKVGAKLDDITAGVEARSGEEGPEGPVTRRYENLTGALPSATWLALAGASVAVATVLKIVGRNHASLFASVFAPSLLLIGVYKKLVKVAGSERRASAF